MEGVGSALPKERGRRLERLEWKVPDRVAGRRPELVAPLCAAESR